MEWQVLKKPLHVSSKKSIASVSLVDDVGSLVLPGAFAIGFESFVESNRSASGCGLCHTQAGGLRYSHARPAWATSCSRDLIDSMDVAVFLAIARRRVHQAISHGVPF